MKFSSSFMVAGRCRHSFSQEEIKKETMLFSADYDFARKNGDGLTNLFLDNIPDEWKNSKLIIDSRVHMLMPGWYPCIPGWHHDDVPRYGRFGQPNYENPDYYSEHLLMVVNAEVAPTEFLVGNAIEVPQVEDDQTVYEVWSKHLNERLKYDTEWDAYLHKVEDSIIYRFDWQTFHRGTAAVKNGWRFFIRASRFWKDSEMTIADDSRFQRRTGKNEIRRQVQVYMEDIEKGW